MQGQGKWKAIVVDYAMPLLHPYAYIVAATSRTKPIIGFNDSPWIMDFTNGLSRYCGKIEDFAEKSKAVLEKLQENEEFLELIIESHEKLGHELEEKAWAAREADFAQASGSEIARIWKELLEPWMELNAWGHAVNMADIEHNMMTDELTAILDKRIAEARISVTTAEAFSSLTTPDGETLLQKQEKEFYELLELIQADVDASKLFRKGTDEIIAGMQEFPAIHTCLSQHVRKHDWMQYHYAGPTILDERHFIEMLASEERQGVKAAQALEILRSKKRGLKAKRRELEEKLSFSEKEALLVRAAREFVYLKGMRKDLVFFASRCADHLVKETAKRFCLSPTQVRHLTLDEITDALQGGPRPDENELNSRIAYSVWLFEEKGVNIFTGEKAAAYRKSIYEEAVSQEATELKGSPAYPGKATGEAKLVARIGHASKMHKGDVLVSPATNPNLVPVMKLASAILTDEGGVTCHAAIVSRELRIPCIVGLKAVTKWVRDGQKVEVDATNGIVRKL